MSSTQVPRSAEESQVRPWKEWDDGCAGQAPHTSSSQHNHRKQQRQGLYHEAISSLRRSDCSHEVHGAQGPSELFLLRSSGVLPTHQKE